jgi:lipopolysaccharide transport system permease protein
MSPSASEAVPAAAPDQPWSIEPVQPGIIASLRELWSYRRLGQYFAVDAVKSLYEGTGLGIFWLFARPLLPVLISTLIFGGLLGAQSDGLPYFLFNLTTTSVWTLFERSLLWSTKSLDSQSSMLKKLYFPRIIIPLASVAPAVAYFFIYLALIVCAAVYYVLRGHRWYLAIGPGWLVAFGAALLSVLLAVAIGLFTSVWQARYRDVRFGLRYVTQFWFYLTPVLYPMSQVPPNLHWVIYLNPMAAIVETFKWGILGVGQFPGLPLVASFAIFLVVGTLGVWYFTRTVSATVDEM